jgi:hypothetical protein
MTQQDDRTPEQKKTHQWAVVAKGKFMSGWGGAEGGDSRCAWATETHANAERIRDLVAKRSEMRYVRIVHLKRYRAPRGTVHFHIYVANPGHPSLPTA